MGTETRQKLITAVAVATALGIGSLILQRWVAETRGAAIAMVVAWYALVGIAALAYTRTRPWARLPALGTVAAVVVATVAVGYWTGFRDDEVDEEVAVAAEKAGGAERDAGLSGGEEPAKEKKKPVGPGRAGERRASPARTGTPGPGPRRSSRSPAASAS